MKNKWAETDSCLWNQMEEMECLSRNAKRKQSPTPKQKKNKVTKEKQPWTVDHHFHSNRGEMAVITSTVNTQVYIEVLDASHSVSRFGDDEVIV